MSASAQADGPTTTTVPSQTSPQAPAPGGDRDCPHKGDGAAPTAFDEAVAHDT